MKRAVVIVIAVLAAAPAAAQPGTQPPGPPGQNVPPPPVHPDDDPILRCKAQRAAGMRQAQARTDIYERTRMLSALPSCVELETARDERLRVERERAQSGTSSGDDALTAEIGIGLGMITLTGYENGGSVKGLAGHLGLGGRLGKSVALTMRFSATAIADDGFGVLAFLGPSLQLWGTPQVFFAGGIGVGLAFGCGDDDCGSEKMTSIDLRAGYAFNRSGRGGNVQLSMTTAGSVGVTAFGVTFGYQR